jgi:hypothetical protein
MYMSTRGKKGSLKTGTNGGLESSKLSPTNLATSDVTIRGRFFQADHWRSLNLTHVVARRTSAIAASRRPDQSRISVQPWSET